MIESMSSGDTAPAAEAQEFATEPVPAERMVGWLGVGLISGMVAFSLPTFVTGAEIFLAADNVTAVAATLTGCLLLAVIASICGVIGTLTHLSSYMLARIAFGRYGAALVNIAFALSLLGWFGVNIDLFSGALLRLLGDSFGIDADPWVVELLAGAVMTTTTIYGFRAIEKLSMMLVPIMMLVTGMLFINAIELRSFTETLAVEQLSIISFGDAISSVVGGVIIGAVILPDITRFIRHWRGAIYTSLLSYFVVSATVMIVGGLAADALANNDFLDVMLLMGLGWAAFTVIIAGSWVLNSLNLYSTVLSVEATVPRARSRRLVVALGALGTLAAFMNVLDHFLTFLFYLAIVFVPVAGVIAADYIFVHRAAYHGDLQAARRRVSPRALAAWAAGSAVALLGAEGVVSLSGVAAIDAMLVSALSYIVLSRLRRSASPAVPEC